MKKLSKPTTALTAGRPSARTDKARAATLASLADDAGGDEARQFRATRRTRTQS